MTIFNFATGCSRGSHGEDNNQQQQQQQQRNARYGSHVATPGDSTTSALPSRSRRPHGLELMAPPNNAVVANPLDDVITSSKPLKTKYLLTSTVTR